MFGGSAVKGVCGEVLGGLWSVGGRVYNPRGRYNMSMKEVSEKPITRKSESCKMFRFGLDGSSL